MSNKEIDYRAISSHLQSKYGRLDIELRDRYSEITLLGDIYTSSESLAGMLLDVGVGYFFNYPSDRVNSLLLQLHELLNSDFEYGEYEMNFILYRHLDFDYGWSLHFESIRSFLQYLIFCAEDYVSEKNDTHKHADEERIQVREIHLDYLAMSRKVWDKYYVQESKLETEYSTVIELGNCFFNRDRKRTLLDEGFNKFIKLHPDRVQALIAELRSVLNIEYEYGDYELSYLLSRFLSFGYGWKESFESPRSLIRFLISCAEYYSFRSGTPPAQEQEGGVKLSSVALERTNNHM